MTTGVSLLTLPSLSMPVRPDDDVDNEDEDYDSTARPSSGASILLIDYAINDAFELQVQNSRLSVDVYKNAKRTLKPLNQSEAVYLQVVAATEAMVRFLLNGARVRSALLVVEGSCWRSTRNTVDAHASVARHYGVPFFDFAATLRNGIRPVQSNYMQQLSAWSGGPMRSMMRRDNTICDACIRTKKLGCESSRTPVIFSDGKHPDYRGHIYVASALRALLNAWAHDPILSSTSAPAALAPPPRDEDLPSPISPAALLAQFTLCSRPTTVYSATAAMRHPSSKMLSNVTVIRGSWSLFADRKGKPGWISTGPNGSTIEFGMRFGRSPRLSFAWTLGYEGFSNVAVGFGPPHDYKGTKRIDGLRTDGVNVTQAATIDLQVGHMMHGESARSAGGVAGWAIKPFSTANFRVTLVCGQTGCGKFKILGLRAC